MLTRTRLLAELGAFWSADLEGRKGDRVHAEAAQLGQQAKQAAEVPLRTTLPKGNFLITSHWTCGILL